MQCNVIYADTKIIISYKPALLFPPVPFHARPTTHLPLSSHACCNAWQTQTNHHHSVICSWTRFMTVFSYCSPNAPVFSHFLQICLILLFYERHSISSRTVLLIKHQVNTEWIPKLFPSYTTTNVQCTPPTMVLFMTSLLFRCKQWPLMFSRVTE